MLRRSARPALARLLTLAEDGYAAFAADLYGKGVRPDTREAKKARSGELYQDREAMRARTCAPGPPWNTSCVGG